MTDMIIILKLYAIAFPVFFALDMIWLGLVAKNFYRQQLGYLMAPQVNWLAALAFYLLFLVGVVLFVVMPAFEKQSWTYALGMGALFGFVTYATYDLTNLATVKNWPLPVTIVDLAWGATLSATVALATYLIAAKIGV